MRVKGLLKALDGKLSLPPLQCELEEKLASFKISLGKRNSRVNLAM